MKPVKFTDKEIEKLLLAFGKKILVNQYINGKIYLTQSQLDYIIENGGE